jgi:hypothetical protein
MSSVVILVTILTVGILQPIITVKNCFYTMVLKITLEFLSVLKYSNFIFFFYEYNNFNVFKFFYFIFSFMRDKLFTIKITFVINLSRDNFNVQSLCIFHNRMHFFFISTCLRSQEIVDRRFQSRSLERLPKCIQRCTASSRNMECSHRQILLKVQTTEDCVYFRKTF